MPPDDAPPPAGPLTRLLAGVERDEAGAREALFDAVYGELRSMAGSRMAGERRDHTLQPTALVHEAFVKLVGRDAPGWQDRGHFLNAAARAMRQILVDHARSRGAQKRGGGAAKVTLEETSHGTVDAGAEVLEVHEALGRLEAIEGKLARVVELRYFAGLTVEETAAVLGSTERTVYRLWERARIWLLREMA
ncbi:MAG: sigma-70 family RNA polymerase sigma factor [Planctomycetota bacterium]|nr:sigma-70 family RNA polymerase sigma factor [Planctomycetota bacterium]